MRRLIVGCGYLGERVARAWLKFGDDVLALTRSRTHAEEMHALGIQPIVGDVTDLTSIRDAVRDLPDIDTVLYAVGFDRDAGKSKREVYVDGLENVLKGLSGRVGRICYISSTSVYGQSGGEVVDEDSECNPSSENGRICTDAERKVWQYYPADSSAGERGASVLRLAGIYGPGRLLARVESLRSGEPLSGNPEAWLNLIHVDDAVAAVLASEQLGRLGSTYLVSDDRPVQRRVYYDLLARLISAPQPTFVDAEPNSAESRQLNKRCCNRRIRDELGVELVYPNIEVGIPHALSNQ